MLGGNAEFLAKIDLKKNGYSEEEIAAATGMSDEIDERCAAARALFRERLEKYKEQIAPEAARVRAAGGLFILGTERHESRRIDNQLRGRSGRQGDPGESRFYLSLEDDLMRLFGSERILGIIDRLGLDEDQPIDAKILSGSIENAQKRLEGENFSRRKTVLEYDDVMNQQRTLIYNQRREVLDGENISPTIQRMISETVADTVHFFTGGAAPALLRGPVGVPDPRGADRAADKPRAGSLPREGNAVRRGGVPRGGARRSASERRLGMDGTHRHDGGSEEQRRFAGLRAKRPRYGVSDSRRGTV